MSWLKIYRQGKSREGPKAPAGTVYRGYGGLGREGLRGCTP